MVEKKYMCQFRDMHKKKLNLSEAHGHSGVVMLEAFDVRS